MKTRHIFFVCIILSVIFSGCGKNGPLFYKKSSFFQKINVNKYSIYYNDQRLNVDYNDLLVSLYRAPGEAGTIAPAVDSELKTITNRIFETYKGTGEIDVIIEVCIVEGYAEFVARSMLETEKVLCRLKVNVMEKETSNLIKSSTGECWGQRKSLEASDEMLRSMFYKSYEMALADALNKLQVST